MRITDPRNANGDKLLSVREVANRYKRIVKTIPTAGNLVGVVVLTSDDIDAGRNITDYSVLNATVLTKSEGLVSFLPLMSIVHEQGEDHIHLRFFDEVSSTTDLDSYDTTITLEDSRNVINTNVDATSLAEEVNNRANEISGVYAAINSISATVPFGASTIENVDCDSASCVLTFGETKMSPRGVEYTHDGHWYNLTTTGESFACNVNFATNEDTSRVYTFYVIIDLNEKTNEPNIILPAEIVKWRGGVSPTFAINTLTVMKFTQIRQNLIIGEVVTQF